MIDPTLTASFAAYAEAYPLAPGWEERVALHQIAPLVVHAIKFGGGYVSSAAAAIAHTPEKYRRFTKAELSPSS